MYFALFFSFLHSEEPKMKMKDDPRYARYFKMIQIGVPMAQVKQKMMIEGFDPDMLE